MEKKNGNSGIEEMKGGQIKGKATAAGRYEEVGRQDKSIINETENKNSGNSSLTLNNSSGIVVVGIIAVVCVTCVTIYVLSILNPNRGSILSPTPINKLNQNPNRGSTLSPTPINKLNQNPNRGSTSSPTSTKTPRPSLTFLIESFRDNLIDWYKRYKFEKKASSNNVYPKMDPDTEKDLDNIIYQINELYKSQSLSLNDIQKARAKFYVSYWFDFKTRVLKSNSKANSKECIRASSLYSEAIRLYLSFLKSGGKITRNDSPEHFFIIIELSHWLINRDAGGYTKYPHEKAKENNEAKRFEKGFDTANTLLKLLEKNLTSYDDELRSDFYITRGIINANNGNHADAIEDFDKAKIFLGNVEGVNKDKLAELNYNLALAKFYNKDYDESISLYNQVINNKGKKINLNIVHRDLGFALILKGQKEGKIEGNDEKEKDNYTEAIENFKKIIKNSSSEYMKVAVLGKAIATYLIKYKSGEEEAYSFAIKELEVIRNTDIGKNGKDFLFDWHEQERKVSSWSLMNFLEHFTFGSFVIHGKKEDDVLKIFHDDFYCDSDDVRKVDSGY